MPVHPSYSWPGSSRCHFLSTWFSWEEAASASPTQRHLSGVSLASVTAVGEPVARPGFGIREPCASRARPHTALHPTKPQGRGWGDKRQAVSSSCLSPCDPPATRPCVPCRSPACQHGSHKPGEPITQRTEEPLVPSAGARQHAQGAARGDQATAATLHRCGGGGTQHPSGTGAERWGWGAVPGLPARAAEQNRPCHQDSFTLAASRAVPGE